MGFDITPPKKRRPVKQPQAKPASRPAAPKATTPPKSNTPKRQAPKQTKPKRKKKVFGKVISMLIILALVAGVVYAFREGYIVLPETADNTITDTVDDNTIVATFGDEPAEDDLEEEETEDEGVDVINDPLMSAHLDFVQMVESLPEEPQLAGYDLREVQLLNTYVNDF
ncbi:MAG: hypothetical protein ACPGO5_00645 [Patescibacteria group bacterium]